MSEGKLKSITERKCYLMSLSNQLKVVDINEQIKFLGRSAETGIDDPFCSRKQICLKANLNDSYVLLKSVGANASALNGFVLESNSPYECIHGDVIELIHNKYMFEIVFDPPPISQQLPTSSSSTPNVFSNSKDSIVIESNDDHNNSAKRREKEEQNLVPNKMKKVDRGDESPTINGKTAEEDKWEKIDGGKLYIFTPKGVKASSKIAAYDMDGTLIKTKSGNVFPKDVNDWQIAFSEVPKKLKSLYEEGYKIVIFTNQAGISKGKIKIEDFKGKIESLLYKLNIPIQVFIATGKGTYRKPMIGMWETLCFEKNQGLKISIEDSFYIGDAAGRPEVKKPVKIKKDHSCADRLMALNIGLKFYTPEEHFLKARTAVWVKPEFDPTTYSIPPSILEPSNAKMIHKNTEAIIMVGIPGSGKSFFSKQHFEKSGYKIANRDKLGTWQKCASVMENELTAKKSLVVDNTNPDIESRKRYIDVAKKHNIPIRCFIMNTSYKHAKHNNLFREITDSNHVAVNEMVFNSFKSKFQEPTIGEGFAEIVKVNFIPHFKDEKQEKLYKMYLLDS